MPIVRMPIHNSRTGSVDSNIRQSTRSGRAVLNLRECVCTIFFVMLELRTWTGESSLCCCVLGCCCIDNIVKFINVIVITVALNLLFSS